MKPLLLLVMFIMLTGCARPGDQPISSNCVWIEEDSRSLTMAVGMSLVGVMVGNLGSIIMESVRLNSVHLSYRMNRIPWRQYWAVLFVSGFVIFGLAALDPFWSCDALPQKSH